MAVKFTDQGEQFDPRAMRQLIRELELEIGKLKAPANVGYTVTNLVKTRSLDVTGATLAQVGHFVGTLVEDLKAVGRLGR